MNESKEVYFGESFNGEVYWINSFIYDPETNEGKLKQRYWMLRADKFTLNGKDIDKSEGIFNIDYTSNEPLFVKESVFDEVLA